MKYFARKIIKRLVEGSAVAVRVTFFDGSVFENHPGREPEVQFVFNNWRGEFSLVTQGEVGFMEAYFNGHIDIPDESLERLFHLGRAAKMDVSFNPIVWVRQVFHEMRTNNRSERQAKENAMFHYNFPARFYELIQGKTYGYVEGYWVRGDEPLDESMHNRFLYMCRKLFLSKGQHVAEVGSGWGYMTCLMAQQYGVTVDSYGIVENQNKTLLEMASQWGVSDKVTLIKEDHRRLAERPEQYDRYVSLGVYEHAGKDCQEAWIRSIAESLKYGGIGLLSTMAYQREELTYYLTTRYIFPGGNIPCFSETVRLLNKYGLFVIDVENARHHYGRACAEWARNFKANWGEIHALDPDRFNERFRRIWYFYLLGASTSFDSPHSELSVYQIVFQKGHPDSASYPATRHFLYDDN